MKDFISISDLFSKTFDYYKANWKLLSIIQIPSLVIAVVSIISSVFLKSIPLSIFYGVAGLLVAGFSWLALMWVITKDNQVSWQDSFRKGVNLIIPASIVGILVFLITIGGLILLIIPGIYWAVCYGFAHYVLFVEGKQGMEALRQSKRYVKGFWWSVLLRAIVFGLGVGVIQIFLGAANIAPQWESIRQATMEGTDPEITGFPALDIVASAFSILVVTPMSLIYSFFMYESLKEIKGE